MRLVSGVLLLLLATMARADAGLDLIVLVDRSTSMTRDAHIGTLCLQMTLDLVARNAASHRIEHRLAVVGFGSQATVDVPFTPVRQRDLRELRRRLKALPSGDRGDTNVLTAFLAAEKLFRSLPADPARRRAIVLLTDGVPYVRGADMARYRAHLRQFVAEHFRQPGISVDVLLAGDQHDRALWQSVARNVYAAPRAADALLTEAHGVVAQLVGTRTAPSAPSKTNATVDSLVVPPYLDVVVFDVFHASPGATVEIYPPGSTTPLRTGVGGVELARLGDVLFTLVVPRPEPGEWTIRKSRTDARVRILSQQFFPRGMLIRPAPDDGLRQHDRIPLAYRVLDSSNRPLAEIRDYALAVQIFLTKPDGRTSMLTTERDAPLGPAVFRSTEDAECDVAGRYWSDVRITTTDAQGRSLEVFRDRWSGFSVAPATRVDCRVSAADTVAWLPMTARIDCAIAERPVEMTAIASGPPAQIFRALLSRDGQRTEAALDLRYLACGAFRGAMYGAWRRGAYQLQFGIDRRRLRSPYNVRFVPPRLDFNRRSGVEWVIAALLAAGAIAVLHLRRRKTRT